MAKVVMRPFFFPPSFWFEVSNKEFLTQLWSVSEKVFGFSFGSFKLNFGGSRPKS